MDCVVYVKQTSRVHRLSYEEKNVPPWNFDGTGGVPEGEDVGDAFAEEGDGVKREGFVKRE